MHDVTVSPPTRNAQLPKGNGRPACARCQPPEGSKLSSDVRCRSGRQMMIFDCMRGEVLYAIIEQLKDTMLLGIGNAVCTLQLVDQLDVLHTQFDSELTEHSYPQNSGSNLLISLRYSISTTSAAVSLACCITTRHCIRSDQIRLDWINKVRPLSHWCA